MSFSSNESGLDRVIRLIAAAVLAGLALAGVITGTLAIVAWVVAVILAVTGLVGFCPLYALLRIRTTSASR